MIALEARGKGLMGVTLRYPYEIRSEQDYFEDIPNEKIPKDMLELATHIVDTKTGDFEPSKFEDQYESALKELLKKKQQWLPSRSSMYYFVSVPLSLHGAAAFEGLLR